MTSKISIVWTENIKAYFGHLIMYCLQDHLYSLDFIKMFFTRRNISFWKSFQGIMFKFCFWICLCTTYWE